MPTASRTYSKSSNVSGELYWPANIWNGYDYLQMDISEFVPRAQSQQGQIDLNQTTTSSTGTPLDSLGSLSAQGFFGQVFNGSTGTQLKNANTVLLPVPEDVQYTDSLNWSDQAVGALGRYGPGVAAQAMGGGSAGSIADSLAELAGAGSLDVVKKIIGNLGADPNAITQNLSGQIVNPYVEQVFSGMNLRQFEFNWKLVPRSPGEQASIHNIIKTLRKAALPGSSSDFKGPGADAFNENTQNLPTTDRWLNLPNIFNLRWMLRGEQLESLPKIKPCVLKNIQVSYTPDNVWATHLKDGAKNPYPVAYNLSLSFGETEIILSDDVEKGY